MTSTVTLGAGLVLLALIAGAAVWRVYTRLLQAGAAVGLMVRGSGPRNGRKTPAKRARAPT